jgi:hypothetical protein
MWALKSLKRVVTASRVVAGGWMKEIVVFGAVRHSLLMDS